MSELNKQFQYGDHKFNIKVELNHLVEKRIGGKKEHRIILNHMGPSNYYRTSLCQTPELEKTISLMEGEAKSWVDSHKHENKSQEEKILEGLGFK